MSLRGGRQSVRGILTISVVGLLGLSTLARADVTPPAIDVVPCPHCRGAAADIDACDAALDRDDNDAAIALCSKALRSEHLSRYDRAIAHIDRGVA